MEPSFGQLLRRALVGQKKAQSVSSVDNGRWLTVFESYTGAWQQDVTVSHETVVAYYAIFACATLIANDIGKMRFKLMEEGANGVWTETKNYAHTPVLRKPNRYQTANQFRENWAQSKVLRGNAYTLKQRDARGVVTGLYLLDPDRVTPLVASDGAVYYRLTLDHLRGIEESQITVPASEIIHDRMNCLFHPLVGLPAIFACGTAGVKGLAIEKNSTRFFNNMSRPSGYLTAPGAISDETATRLKTSWDANFGGENFGKTAVFGDALEYKPLAATAEEAQMVEQMKLTAEQVCTTFHVPAFKIGVGVTPTYQNAEVLNQIYYSDCLQSIIEQMETCLDEGLGLVTNVGGRPMGVELDIDALFRMDKATQIKTLAEGVKGSIYTPNEARQRVNLIPLEGGDTVYLQQQNYAIEALAKRDANDPFSTPEPQPDPPPEPEPTDDELADQANMLAALLTKELMRADVA